MTKPEILSPCGNFEKLRFAVLYGADAVYLAGKRFGMRSASDNFTDAELKDAIAFAHSHGVKVYVTVNIMPRQSELSDCEEYLKYLEEIRPDAVIVADLGVLRLANKLCPHVEKHISTQTSTVNAQACLTFAELGATRIVLSRELSLREIRAIRDAIPDSLELEAFVRRHVRFPFGAVSLVQLFRRTRRQSRRVRSALPLGVQRAGAFRRYLRDQAPRNSSFGAGKRTRYFSFQLKGSLHDRAYSRACARGDQQL